MHTRLALSCATTKVLSTASFGIFQYIGFANRTYRRPRFPRASQLIAAAFVAAGFVQGATCHAAATVSPTSLNWAFVPVGGRGGPKLITLKNTGTSAITISSIKVAGSNAADFPIYAKTCGTTLAASASCTVTMVFSPTTTGNRSAVLQLTDTGGNSPQTVALTGLGTVPNSLTANPGSLSFAGTSVGSSSAAQSVVLTNALTSAVTISSVAISGTNAGDFILSSNSCGTTLVAGGSCTGKVIFKPTASGTRTAVLRFTDTATNSPQSVALSGTGSSGTSSATVSPTSLNWAFVAVGGRGGPKAVTLTNTGSSAMAISSIAVVGANPGDFPISAKTCGTSLAVSASCTATIVFAPTVTGNRSASLQFNDSAGNSPQLVPLTGLGTAPASVAANPVSLTFANTSIGSSSAAQSVVLTNALSSSVTITSVAISGANAGDFVLSSNSCGASLGAGANCTAGVVFTPTAAGTRSATLQFTDSATNSPQSVALSGTGSGGSGNATVSPTSLNWAFVAVGGRGGPKAITLTNTGSGPITISSIVVGGTNPSDFVISAKTCGTTLAASASCTATIVFAPTVAANRSATLQFNDTAGNNPQTVALTGLGTAPNSVSPNPGSLSFASTSVGSTSAAQSVVLTNALTSAVTISSVAIAGSNAGDFVLSSNTCPATLVAGGNCTAAVTFKPTTGGTRTATLQFTDSATNSPQAVTLTGTATGSSVTITPSSVNLHALNTQTFVANAPVTWSASCGSITSAGVYTAPAINETCGITATASSGTATALADVDISNYTARKGGGANLGLQANELALTPSNVNANSFGLKWTTPVDAWVNAQPLYMNALPINGSPHNVVFVVTANDSVYALDGETGVQIWHDSLIPAGATAVSGSTVGFTSAPLIGILSTPVIDPATNTMYVVSETAEQNATFFAHRLHALDVTTGNEKFGGPVLISDSQMAPIHRLQRSGLLLANGNVYVAIGSMQDMQPYHGFLFSFNAKTLAQEAVWNSTPTGAEGGIWMGGAAPAVDEDGNIYVNTGNGTLDGTTNFGEASVKLSPTLQLLDYFAPFDFGTLNAGDVDLGSGTILVVPNQNGSHPHELIVCGKPTPVYVLDRDNLGKVSTNSDQIIQRLDNQVGAFNPKTNSTQACFTGPAMWGQNVYYGGKYDHLKMFTLDANTGLLSSSPVSQGTVAYGYPGTDPVISANGSTNGIVWTIDTSTSALIAVDATDLTKTLFSGPLAGGAIRWTVPTPINGHVYVGEEGMVFGFALK